MRREFRLQDAKSDKFWIVSVSGASHTVHFGRAGTKGQQKTKDFESGAAALAAAEKLISAKLKKGYLETQDTGDTAEAAPDPELVAEAASEPNLASEGGPPGPKAPSPKAPGPKAPGPKAPVAKATRTTAPGPEAPDPLAEIAALSPQAWRLAGWRGLPPLEPGRAKPFKRAASLKKLRGLQKNYARDYREAHKLWKKVISTALSRAEAEFWWQALRRLKQREGPDSVAESLERLTSYTPSEEDLASSLPAEPTGHDAAWIGQAAGPDGAFRLLPLLMGPRVFLDSLRASFEGAGIWTRAGAGMRPLVKVLDAFGRHVLPYLSREDLEGFRERLRQDLAGVEDWPIAGSPVAGPVAYYFAGLVGCSEPIADLASSWADDRYRASPQDAWYQGPIRVLFGLAGPGAIVAEARRLGLEPTSPLEFEAWIAATGEAGLEGAAATVLSQPAYVGTDLVKVFGLYRTPSVVPHMIRVRAFRPTANFATKWFPKHPLVVARGYLRLAGGEGGDAAEAVDRLIDLQDEEPELFAAACAAEAPAPEVLALLSASEGEESLSLEDLSVELRRHFAAVAALGPASPKEQAAWLSLRRTPAIRIGESPLGPAGLNLVVRALQASPLEIRPEGPGPDLLAALMGAAEAETLEDFGWSVFQGWLSNGTQSGQKWCLTGLGYLGGDRVVRLLTPLIRAWPGESQHARAVTGLEVLRQIGSDAALGAIAGIAAKVKFRGLKNRAAECMDLIAAGRGLTREQLGDRLVPECGLDAGGQRVFDYGPRRFEFVLGPELKPMVRNEAGKLLKAPPKPGKKDDPELAPRAFADWKIFKKLATDTVKLQVHRLELAMVCGRRWSPEEFQRFFVQHPLLRHLTRSLLWASHAGRSLQPFRLDAAGAYLDAKGSPVDIGSGPIGLVHPLELSAEERSRWDALWDEVEVLAPFPQLDREVFTLPEGSGEAVSLDVGEIVLTPRKLRGVLIGAGWLRGEAQDAGIVSEHVKHFESANLTAILQHEGISVSGYDYWEQAPVERCFFLEGIHEIGACAWVSVNRGIPLQTADPVVLSEVIRDLTFLAEAASEE